MGFNAATAVRPWKTAKANLDSLVTALIYNRHRFNVATAVRPWKTTA